MPQPVRPWRSASSATWRRKPARRGMGGEDMKIIPEVAARVMGKNPQFVRIGLQRGLLPFGVAMQTDARNPRSRHNGVHRGDGGRD